ncbi:hypothetical protein SAMN05421823_102237 [Catalinimonas alkaloidigena]|uniref:Uncharacterized protein n=1 Tax=Catalinimonas alkaloidigena TaxID=1075417 RepID=A0A1G9ABE6_9BACT|nr:hypothetical protein [Catalinimonas alkaloidigena]SDK24598.1 hypothetical protein SAMN05421823_102237 [Catalinimonas alkaloidigena]
MEEGIPDEQVAADSSPYFGLTKAFAYQDSLGGYDVTDVYEKWYDSLTLQPIFSTDEYLLFFRLFRRNDALILTPTEVLEMQRKATGDSVTFSRKLVIGNDTTACRFTLPFDTAEGLSRQMKTLQTMSLSPACVYCSNVADAEWTLIELNINGDYAVYERSAAEYMYLQSDYLRKHPDDPLKLAPFRRLIATMDSLYRIHCEEPGFRERLTLPVKRN